MRARRTTTVVAVVAALATGHAIASLAEPVPSDFPPFVEDGGLTQPVHLSYADVTVTDVRPAKYVAPLISDDLASMASGVWVLVSVRATASSEPARLSTPALLDEEDRLMRASPRSQCPSGMTLDTGVPAYALFCFDVPHDKLAGLRLQVGRGSVDNDSLRGDHVAVVDLEISGSDEREWAETDDVFAALPQSLEPLELESVELAETPAEDS